MATTTRHRGRFRSEYTDDMRLEAIGLVATGIKPNEPTAVTQNDFDIHAAGVIARERPEWPEPPTARALWMQLTRADEPSKRSWRELIELAVTTTSIAHATSAATREEPLPDWFEEPHVVFAVRRVHLHLRLGGDEAMTLDQYDAGRADLLRSVRGERREQLTLLLPKGSQLARLADHDWNVILELCGLPRLDEVDRPTAHPRELLAWHYYETQGRLPRYADLGRYYRPLGIAVPTGVAPWSQVHDAVAAKRAERGWTTPPDGPPEDERLTEEELAALLNEAPKAIRPRGYWNTDTITDALVEYLDEFEGVAQLRQKHFIAVRAVHGWPTWEAIRTKLMPGRNLTWDEALAIARRERRRRSARPRREVR